MPAAIPLAAAAVSAGGAIYSANKSAKATKKAAESAQRDLYQEGVDSLQAQIDMAPQLYASEAQYQPKYAELNRQISYDNLMGDNGTLAQYEAAMPTLNRLTAESNTAAREADLADVQTLGSGYAAAIRAANPQLTAVQDKLYDRAVNGSQLLNTMESQTLADLQKGGYLNADELRQAQQSVRSAYGSRGLSGSSAAAMAEALQRTKYVDNRKQLALGNAMEVDKYKSNLIGTTAQQLASTSVDPVSAILGRSSSSLNSAQGAAGASGFTLNNSNSLFDPYNSYAADVYSSNANANFSSGMAQANNYAALSGSLFKTSGDLLSSYYSNRG